MSYNEPNGRRERSRTPQRGGFIQENDRRSNPSLDNDENSEEYRPLDEERRSNRRSYRDDNPRGGFDPNNCQTYTPLIFPDMFKTATKEAPFSAKGRIVLPWYKNKYQNHMEAVNCTALTEDEMNFSIFDLEDQTDYWSPKCLLLKILFWFILLLAIVGVLLLIILPIFVKPFPLAVWLRVLIIIAIIIVAIILLVVLSICYKNYLISREFRFKKRVRKLNRRIFEPIGTELKVGTFGAWLEVVYDPDDNVLYARNWNIQDLTQVGKDKVEDADDFEPRREPMGSVRGSRILESNVQPVRIETLDNRSFVSERRAPRVYGRGSLKPRPGMSSTNYYRRGENESLIRGL